MTTQLAVRIEDEIAEGIDALVRTGRFDNRTEVIRFALADLLDRERRAEIGRRIAAGYTESPQSDAEVAGHLAAARAMIAQEPW